jgi:hypothetical protein
LEAACSTSGPKERLQTKAGSLEKLALAKLRFIAALFAWLLFASVLKMPAASSPPIATTIANAMTTDKSPQVLGEWICDIDSLLD